jgi:kynurenine formamidase
MIPGGKYIDEMPVEHFVGPGVVIDVRGKNLIDETVLIGSNVRTGSILLLYTGMSEQFRTDTYNTAYPRISESFAKAVVDAGVKIIGIDMLSPDIEETFPVHKILLSKEVLIIENLTNLESLIGVKNFEVLAFPMKLHAEAAPVRVVARIPN